MRILLITSAYNSLTQRAHVELRDAGHEVSIELALNNATMLSAVNSYQPDLIIAPMLKRAIPKAIWSHYICLIVHPGIKGDRGPSALDWAIMEQPDEWGVTLLQADEQMDAGDIWATRTFPMREGSKGSIYRREVSDAAMACIFEALEKFDDPDFKPEPLDYRKKDVKGRERPLTTQLDRYIDWNDSTNNILNRLWAADGAPGVLDLFGQDAVYLYGAHRETHLRGKPGEILAQRDGAVCIGASDGAIWITHAKPKDLNGHGIKLPAAKILIDHLQNVPYVSLNENDHQATSTWNEIHYHEKDEVGYLDFDFYNGAMSTEQCHSLRRAYTYACTRPTKVIVLNGGSDFWSNGIHLNEIEAARIPAEEAWANIQAINDLVLEIITTNTHWVISSMAANAGAGGVTMALAADEVLCRKGVVLNPHYKSMGGLYGSEYWTYLIPRRVGSDAAEALCNECLPVSARSAKRMGLIDDVISATEPEQFKRQVHQRAVEIAQDKSLSKLLKRKHHRLMRDQAVKPLSEYRREELQRMWQNFFGNDQSFHQARREFVYKAKARCTPERLALHRQGEAGEEGNVISLAVGES